MGIMNYSHANEELIKVKKLLFEACQLLDQVDFLPQDSDLGKWFDDEQSTRALKKEKNAK